jgi:phage-related protein
VTVWQEACTSKAIYSFQSKQALQHFKNTNKTYKQESKLTKEIGPMKKNRSLCFKQSLILLTLATLFCFTLPASAQPSVPQDLPHDEDTTRAQYAAFDRFLDSHPEVAEQLRKDPALMRNDEFREDHPALQEFLQQHPGIREEFEENPNAFMRQQERFDRRDDGSDRDVTRAQLARMDQFLDSHPEIAEQLRKNPDLMKSDQFAKTHPALQEFLRQHPGIREEFAENPNAFMRQEQRFDRHEDGHDGDATRAQLARMDQFLDSHPEVAEQLRKNPDLMKSDQFAKTHPELHEFLQQHPGIREEFAENPNAFMRQEQRFDRHEDSHDGDATRAQLARMDQFLDSHPEVAEQLRKDPGLMKSDEFAKTHPALQEFLQQHPGIREEFAENPNAFLRQEEHFDRHEDSRELAGFGQFLASHSTIAQQLSRDPRLANNQQFIDSHPELQEYLNAHPGVRDQLTQNPRAVMGGIQPLHNSSPSSNTGKTFNLGTAPAPTEKQ